MKIRLGHSPDPDDAFMFWGLAAGEVDSRGFEFEHVLRDIQTLNEWALEGRLEVTAISLHSYPFVQDQYVLLPHGASMGAGYGPIVVAREPLTRRRPAPGRDRRARADDDRVPRAASPASASSPGARCRSTRSWTRSSPARPTPACSSTRGSSRTAPPGCTRCVDLGEWWLADTGLPLPLGANVARRDLGPRCCASCRRSSPTRSAPGSSNRERALEYALQFGRGLDDELADRFVGMYVNELTRTTASEGGEAVAELLRRGEEIGAFREPVRVEFVGIDAPLATLSGGTLLVLLVGFRPGAAGRTRRFRRLRDR